MKKALMFLFCGILIYPLVSRSQTTVANLPKKISPVLLLKPTDKTPSGASDSPAVPEKGQGGNSLEVEEAVGAPSADAMSSFSDPVFFEALKKTKKKETQINRVYWHSDDNGDYCHLRDEAGNHWYGWSDGQKFHWVLFRGNHYWWYDSFAKHWLYFGGRYWFRTDHKNPNDLQVLINGEYYLCQKDGTVLKDMGQDGKGAIISGNGTYQGDIHHGGRDGDHGAHHGDGDHGGHGSPQPLSGTNALSNSGNTASPAGQ